MKFQSWYLWNISTLGTLLNQSDLRTGTNWKELKRYLSYFNTHLLNWRLLFLGGHNYASMWKVILMPKGSMHLLFLIPWTSWPLNSLSLIIGLFGCAIYHPLYPSIYLAIKNWIACLSSSESLQPERVLHLAIDKGGSWRRHTRYTIFLLCVYGDHLICVFATIWVVRWAWAGEAEKNREGE